MLDSTIWLVGRCIARCGSVKTEALLNVEVLKNDMMHECMKRSAALKHAVLYLNSSRTLVWKTCYLQVLSTQTL